MFSFTGFRSYVREFFGAILELLSPSLPWGFAARSGSIFGSSSGSSGIRHSARTRQISQQDKQARPANNSSKQDQRMFIFYGFQRFEVMLGSFSVQFCSFSVPHCHGDLPLGAVRFLGALAVLETVQEQGRMFFFTGFGNYVKDIFGAIWELLRPSLPWGFAAGTGSVFRAVAVLDTVHQQGQRSAMNKKQNNTNRMLQEVPGLLHNSPCRLIVWTFPYLEPNTMGGTSFVPLGSAGGGSR